MDIGGSNDKRPGTKKEKRTADSRNTPSTTNLEEEEIVDALGNDGNKAMPEQVKRLNARRRRRRRRKKKMIFLLDMLYIQWFCNPFGFIEWKYNLS